MGSPSLGTAVRRRRYGALLAGLIALVGLLGLTWLPAAHAEDPGVLTINKTVSGWQDGHEVAPGDTFVYTITITCSNLGSGGCTNAVLTDPLPDGIILDPSSSITVQGASANVDPGGGNIVVTFTDPLADPPGSQGLTDGSSVTVQVPVEVDPNIPPSQNGQDLTNTATVDGTNTASASDDFTVVPNIPVDLEASTSKSFQPDSAIPVPGTATTLTVNGGNASNVPVDRITITDPPDPSATPNPFTYLGLTGTLDVTLPAGAEQVEVDAWVDGAWVDGDPGPPPAALPAGVTAADVTGIRVTFISTGGADIQPGASGSIDVDLVQRANISDAGLGPIGNDVSSTVSAGDQTSDAATAHADYVLTSATLPLAATKSFDPDQIVVGGTSTVTLGATNTSDRTLDGLTLTEPSPDATGPNPFENGLTFNGWADGVTWPAGATGATVTYTFADGSTQTLTTSDVDTLPDPRPGQVVGFTVEFTGPITPGAEATVPFTVAAAEVQGPEELDHPNQVSAHSTAPGGYSGDATASDTLTTIKKRLHVTVDKRVVPSEIFSIPGQVVTVLLSGQLDPFPASTADAHDIIVQDPADLDTDTWYDSFSPTTISETPIPADSTLTVQYWDGTEWVDVPGMVDLAGPQIFTGDLPPDVQDSAQGIRFVYHSDQGFPPGTEVDPNITFQLRDSAAGQDLDVADCDSATATSPDAPPATDTLADCPTTHLLPPTPGNADFIDKSWDGTKLVGERTGEEAGATIHWSTSGASNIPQMDITDVPDPSLGSLPSSVFDAFDLVRIDPITAAMDPHLTYDEVASVELYSASAGGWVDPTDDPCPAQCDGTFPGYSLSPAQQSDVIAFRLVYVESPTRAQRINGDPTAPAVGSGVARSSGNDREIHPVFRIRDDLRSDPDVPVVSDELYNVDGALSQVRNTARASVIVDGHDFDDQDASDIITITPVPVTANLDKTWSGGPLGVPPAGTAFPDDWPTGRVTLDASNTTPRQVDRLTISDPSGLTDPFDTFNLKGFVSITDPATIGADDVTITLDLAGGGTRTLTRAQALAETESDLTDVVGLTVVYTGRIDAGGHGVVVLDTRLRPTHRSDGSPVEPGTTVTDRATAEAADLVNYPGVDPVTSTASDTASIDLNEIGIGLDVTKSFSPGSQTEPDRSPVTMTLGGQPSGPSRTNTMVLTDVDASFWNQYDFVGFDPSFSFTAPIDQVQVDALTGGTFVTQGNDVVLQGATWVDGTPGTTLTLPAGVTAAQVQGLRFTFTRADGRIWENPANPLQQVPIQVQRRVDLHTGGPVPSDLAGNAPAPGEQSAGDATNTFTGDDYGADLVGGEPIHGTDDATATITYHHARTAVEVTKTPRGAQAPGTTIPYTMTFTNTGDWPITDPVITDRLPSDADGPMLILDPDTTDHYTYTLTGAAPDPPNGPAMPTDPGDVTVDETPSVITFTFPTGTVLEVGQTYSITLDLVFRPGLPGNTQVTNTAGITGQRPWDGCVQTLDTDTGECQASTTVFPTRAGALRGVKSVKAVDDQLGVDDTRGTGCTPDADGFYRGGCAPITKPGGDEIWRMTFTNTGNLPMDEVYALDRLPRPGDTGAIIDLPRDSQWTPTPKSVTFAGAELGTVSELRVYYDADDTICTLDLSSPQGCPDGDWTLIQAEPDPANGFTVDIPANAHALKFELGFADQMLQPNGTVKLDLTTTTPAQAPAGSGSDPIAWNTVAQAGETNDAGALGLSPAAEGNKAGVALATGPFEVEKVVKGPAAEYAPDVFTLDLACTSVGETVDLGDQSQVTVAPGEVVRVDDVPWGSTCTATEDIAAAGATHFSANTVTIGHGDQQPVRIQAVNTYDDASLVISKSVSGSAVDQDGSPISYGPFTFDVDCTFLGSAVYAAGYSASNPMTATFRSGESVTFTELPAGSVCTATESDTDGAAGTSSSGSTSDGDVTGTTTIDLSLTEDDQGNATNEVTFDNTFDTGRLVITKVVDGDGAHRYGAGPFTVHLSCTDPDGRSVWDGDIVLGGTHPLTHTVEDLFAGATCRAAETSTGGATHVGIAPDGPFSISTGTPVTLTVTNTFDLGSVEVVKKITGAGASAVGRHTAFRVRLSCTRDVDGTPVDVPIRGNGVRVLSRATGLSVTYDHLPTGAHCSVTEPDTGGADDSRITPGEITVGEGAVARVDVVNTFDGRTGPEHHHVGPTAETGGQALDDHTGLLVGAIICALVAVGGILELARRRRGA